MTGPSRATSGPGKTLSRGPITPHSVCLQIETPKASRGRKRGEGCPFTIWLGLVVRGSVVSSPSGVRPKMDFMHILGQKETIWNTICSIFERRRPLPPNVPGPGKTFPSPISLSRRACLRRLNSSRSTMKEWEGTQERISHLKAL